LKAYSALSPVSGLFSHRRPPITIGRLDSSVGESGPHSFAIRVRLARLASRAASIAFHPAFVAIAIRPSDGMECAHYDFDLGPASTVFLKNRISLYPITPFFLIESSRVNLRVIC
jgi:hypothetical protein